MNPQDAKKTTWRAGASSFSSFMGKTVERRPYLGEVERRSAS